MQIVTVKQPGNYDKLLVEERQTPEPLEGEVQIRVRACGVNFADCCVRMGVYKSAKDFVGWPITPGFEVSGEVIGTGVGVKKFKVGDRVIGLTRFGGYTSHIALPESQIFTLPENMSFEEGAAAPAVFLTAFYATFELAHPKPGHWMLVHSAAGGVGSALIQLCRIQGCHTVGVVGAPHKVDFVKQLGADFVIDKSTQDLWEEAHRIQPNGFDGIFDANGPQTLMESYKHLNSGGKLVVYGFHTMLSKGRGTPNWLKIAWEYLRSPRFDPMQMTTDNHSVLAFNLSDLFDKLELLEEGMEQILRWFKEGKIHVPKVKSYSLEHVAEAHRELESGLSVGKIVLIP